MDNSEVDKYLKVSHVPLLHAGHLIPLTDTLSGHRCNTRNKNPSSACLGADRYSDDILRDLLC